MVAYAKRFILLLANFFHHTFVEGYEVSPQDGGVDVEEGL